MNKRLIRLAAMLLAAVLAVPAHALLMVDQQGAASANGGYGDPVVQTFTPAQDNIAGVDVLIGGTAVFTANVSVSIFSDPGLTNLVATDAIADHPRNTVAEFRWSPVAVLPEALYYMQFITGDLLVMAFISNTTDTYTRGNIIEGGGNLGNLYEDALFTTYFDTAFAAVAAPATLPMLGIALLGLVALRRR